MEQTIKKVIKASAGTGKTYRLSLEFVNLLLQRNIRFDEILVITFTKKATAEIREAILEHILNLLRNNDKGQKIKENLEKLFGTFITNEHLQELGSLYKQMLINKHKLRISTIDSFITSVFKGIIAPYLGITDFRINNGINKSYLPELYQNLTSDEFYDTFVELFKTSKIKTIEGYNKLIMSVIDKRWMIDMIADNYFPSDSSGEPDTEHLTAEYEQQAAKLHRTYIKQMNAVIQSFGSYLVQDGKEREDVQKLVMADYYDALHFKTKDALQWIAHLGNSLANESFVHIYHDKLLDNPKFWSGAKCFRGKKHQDLKNELLQELDQARESLAGYIFFKYLLPESLTIIKLARKVLREYDRIKLRDRIFTYSDITYYTYKHLYNPELSLIDEATGNVENRFYEHLSATTRFVLLDEYQDTSIIQHKILLPVMKEVTSGSGIKDYGGAIVVGDEKQSIYGWRSGERDLLLKIPEILNGAETDSLATSYRSTQFIMDFINDLFRAISQGYKKHFDVLPDESNENSVSSLYEWQYTDVNSSEEKYDGFTGIYLYNRSQTDEEQVDDQYTTFVEKIIKPHYLQKEVDLATGVVLAHTNNQLENIARILEENGIPSYREATVSIIHHQAIKPVIQLLRYLYCGKIIYLLQFLRSDFCLIPPAELKLVISTAKPPSADEHDNGNSELQTLDSSSPYSVAAIRELQDLPQVKNSEFLPIVLTKIANIGSNLHNSDIMSLIASIFEEFNTLTLFPQEHNIKNIHLFMELAAAYLVAPPTPLTSQSVSYGGIGGFLDYLRDNEYNEEFMQTSLEDVNAIRLLSVHKAKGLQFRSVFYFCEDSGGHAGSRDLNSYVRYCESLNSIAEGYLTFNYDRAMKYAGLTGLYREIKAKELIEDLNVIYVALTRAEKNIFLFLPFRKKEGINKHLDDILANEPQDRNISRYLFMQIIGYLNAQGVSDFGAEPLTCYTFGKLQPYADKNAKSPQENTSGKIKQPAARTLLSLNNTHLLRKSTKTYQDYKSIYVENKLPLKGEIVHYYLSFIRYGESPEQQYAAAKTIAFFGNILPQKQITALLSYARIFIEQNSDIFSKDWNKVFTEHTVFDERGNEYRIDRLMINDNRKAILIVDYKTGLVGEPDQLERYKKIIGSLPFVCGYDVNTVYKEISLPKDI